MTPVATVLVLDAESHAEAVTGTAGFPLFHRLHGHRTTFHTCRNQLLVTVGTVISPPQMHLMAEKSIADGTGDLVAHRLGHLVALFTPFTGSKGRFPIVTGTAGLPLLHVGHGVTAGFQTGTE